MPEEVDELQLTSVRLGRAGDKAPNSNLKGLLGNMRLASKAVYNGSYAPPNSLENIPQARFLLKGGYIDRASHRPQLIEGHGSLQVCEAKAGMPTGCNIFELQADHHTLIAPIAPAAQKLDKEDL